MIRDEVVAARVAKAAQEAYRILDDSAALVRAECSEEEIKQYVQAVGNVLYEVIFRVMEPLYIEHPSLKPDGWN
jgi:hypothetical protein